jgi:hypothetical protein
MISRDEEEGRLVNGALDASRQDVDEGMFLADFDEPFDMPTPVVEQAGISWTTARSPTSSSFSSSASNPSPPSPRSPLESSRLSDYSYYAHSLPRRVPSMPNPRVQVSPRFRPEPMEAGFGGMSPVTLSPAVPQIGGDDGHFPPMSRTPSSAGTSTPSTPGTGGISRSASSSPEDARVKRHGAWSTGASTPGTPSTSYSEAASRASASGSPQAQRFARRAPMLAHTRSEPLKNDASGLMSSPPRQRTRAGEGVLLEQDEDEDLKYAIELSLAEARSRGENV